MSKTVPPAQLCGARRPGWENGPAIGINRIPCILAAGHDDDHRNAFGQTWPAAAPLAAALLQLADKLDRRRPRAVMSEALRRAQALVLAEELHGPTPAAEAAEEELLATLPSVRERQTRSQYAAILRQIAQGVTQ
ncbi:hypothetical protein [Streptomyces sp. NPDC059909]|uniref:hypothetical protein n=1 Tax=Streptomyces sp. NPDC059909 TaxID=3346998 RepID=UPI00364B6537